MSTYESIVSTFYISTFFLFCYSSLSMSIINCFFLYSSLLLWLRTIPLLVLLIFLRAVSIMAWATNTVLRSLFCKAFGSFLLLSSKMWFSTLSSSFRFHSFLLKMLHLKQLQRILITKRLNETIELLELGLGTLLERR